MPIHFAAEPANGSALVRHQLERAHTRPSPLTAKAVELSALQINPPHAVYDLRADEIASGRGIASAKHTGYRYLVTAAGANIAGAEVHVDGSGAASLVANINYGPYVEATAHALTQAGALPSVAAGSYEARLLRFSAINLMALWLKPDSGGADIFYPLAPAPVGVNANQPYTEADFLAAIRPLAERRASKQDKASVP